MWKTCIKWKLIISVLFFVLAMQVNWEQNRQPKQKWFFSLQLGEQVYAKGGIVKEIINLLGLASKPSKPLNLGKNIATLEKLIPQIDPNQITFDEHAELSTCIRDIMFNPQSDSNLLEILRENKDIFQRLDSLSFDSTPRPFNPSFVIRKRSLLEPFEPSIDLRRRQLVSENSDDNIHFVYVSPYYSESRNNIHIQVGTREIEVSLREITNLLTHTGNVPTFDIIFNDETLPKKLVVWHSKKMNKNVSMESQMNPWEIRLESDYSKYEHIYPLKFAEALKSRYGERFEIYLDDNMRIGQANANNLPTISGLSDVSIYASKDLKVLAPSPLQYTVESAMPELDQIPGKTSRKENKYPEADESTKQRDQTDSRENKNLKDLIKEIIGCISDTTLAVVNLINDDSKQRSQNILFEDNDKKLGELVKKMKNVEQRKKYVVRQEERFEKAKKKYMEADKDLDQAKRGLREAEGVLELAKKDLENLYDNNNEAVDNIKGKDLVEAIVKCAEGISKKL